MVCALEINGSLICEITKLRTENRRLRRESKWHLAASQQWQERAKSLEAQLHVALAKNRGKGRVKEIQPSGTVTVKSPADTVDWKVWHMLGAGMKPRDPALAIWDNLCVDWSSRDLPKGVVPKTKFWDRLLHLDWSAEGLPKLEFKVKQVRARVPRARPAPEVGPVDWAIWETLGEGLKASGMIATIDQNIGQSAKKPCPKPDDDGDELILDWSGRHLPRAAGRTCRLAGGRRARPGHHPCPLVRTVRGKVQDAIAVAAPQPKAVTSRRAMPFTPKVAKPMAKPAMLIMQPPGRRGQDREARR